MNYFAMFEGIGGFSCGIDRAYEQEIGLFGQYCQRTGKERTADCVGIAEIDKYAFAVFRRHFPEVRNFGNAAGLVPGELPDFELLVAGFPCQAFSIAGKRRGFDDARGTLFFEIARVLSYKRPAHFLLENVKGLGSHDDGKTQHKILEVLSGLGYFVERVLLNSKDYGVPQHRERLFFVGHHGTKCGREILSIGGEGEDVVAPDRERGSRTVIAGTLRTYKDGEGFREMKSGVAPALNARARQDGSQQGVLVIPTTPVPVKHHKVADGYQGQRVYDTNGLAATLKSCNTGGTANEKYLMDDKIRRFTPLECERLQAFEDNWTASGLFETGGGLVELPISDTQRYKVTGNAVTVSVAEAVIRRMRDVGCLE